MKTRNLGPLHIRKWFTASEEVLANESGVLADGAPLIKFIVAVALQNPYAGRFSQDLSDLVEPSKQLGEAIAARVHALTKGHVIESYGKACIVGFDGEYEHGNALITNIGAGPVRDGIGGGKAWVPSTGKRGGPGCGVDIPLAHKDALYVRSHYDTVTVSFSDAPNRDEIVIAWAFATRGRLHARLGGLAAKDVKGVDGLV